MLMYKYHFMQKQNFSTIICLLILTLLWSCKSGPFNLLKPVSPHQNYERKLKTAGLDQTIIGAAWLNNAELSLQKALPITLPYQEKGYFSAEKIEAVAFKFQLTKGQKLQVKLDRKPVAGFMIYLDLWQPDGVNYKLLTSADTLGNNLQLDADETGTYILRLQPELLGSGEFNLAITTGPSLDFPIKAANRSSIKSLWGVGRDNDTRKHEGIDIFAAFRTPVLAVAPGTISRVNTNNLGGKVVWLRPEGKNYTLYYAHLDEQLVADGQAVIVGDTLGLMGATGNAKGGPPHLHFGIYTNGGAVDPLPFVDPTVQVAPKISSSILALNATMRTNSKTLLVTDTSELTLNERSIIRVNAAMGNRYRVTLPNGNIGYLNSNKLTSVTKPLAKYKVKQGEQAAYDQPTDTAAVKLTLKNNETVNLLGNFGAYQLIEREDKQTGWIKMN